MDKEERMIFESAAEARTEAKRRGFGMITVGKTGGGTSDRPWIKLSEWNLTMKGFREPRYLFVGNRLYKITACHFLGYDHSEKRTEGSK